MPAIAINRFIFDPLRRRIFPINIVAIRSISNYFSVYFDIFIMVERIMTCLFYKCLRTVRILSYCGRRVHRQSPASEVRSCQSVENRRFAEDDRKARKSCFLRFLENQTLPGFNETDIRTGVQCHYFRIFTHRRHLSVVFGVRCLWYVHK